MYFAGTEEERTHMRIMNNFDYFSDMAGIAIMTHDSEAYEKHCARMRELVQDHPSEHAAWILQRLTDTQ
jgi:hypothetical protein